MASEEKQVLERSYGKIVLTLDNVLIPEDKLSPTPSSLDGLDSEIEMELRMLGCELIQTSGILLKLPQTAMATGQVLFQRFYYSKSFVKHSMEVIAMGCVNLASKIEEAPRRMRDVLNVFHHIKQVRAGKTISPLILNQDYINLKNQVIKGERRLLKELGFCVHVKHPHKIIVMYLQVLELERNQQLVQKAWWVNCSGWEGWQWQPSSHGSELSLAKEEEEKGLKMEAATSKSFSPQNYMNDSFRTNVFVRYHPETIATACIFLAARQLGVPLPNNPPWYEVFARSTQETLQDIALLILSVYKREKLNAEKLDDAVEKAKKVQLEAKKKAKGDFTPNSRQVSPGTMDSPLTAAKKLRNENDHQSDGSFGARHRSRSRSRSRTPHSITNSRSYHSSSRSPRSRSRSPKHHRDRHRHSRHRHRDSSPKKTKSKSRSGRDDRVSSNDKYKDKYSSRDRYDYDKYNYSKKSSSKRRSASYSPSPTRRSYSSSPERRHKKKSVHRSRHRDRSRSRERHRR